MMLESAHLAGRRSGGSVRASTSRGPNTPVDVKEMPMMRLSTRIVLFALVLMFLGSFLAPTNSHRSSGGPYQSALMSMGTGTAWAAKPGHCNSFCEFIAPGYHCLSEG